jgi:hypothetical protein
MKQSLTTWILYLSFSAFLLCMFLPAFIFRDTNEYLGWGVLLFGPLGLLSLSIAWFANPLLCFSWFYTMEKDYKKGSGLALGSLAVALTFLFQEKLHEGSAGFHTFEIGSGYYVWVTSIALALFSSLYGKITHDTTNQP